MQQVRQAQIGIDLEEVFGEAARQHSSLLNRCMFLAGQVSTQKETIAKLTARVEELEGANCKANTNKEQ